MKRLGWARIPKHSNPPHRECVSGVVYQEAYSQDLTTGGGWGKGKRDPRESKVCVRHRGTFAGAGERSMLARL